MRASLAARAPVIAGLELDGLQVHLTHLAPGRYDIDDLLERFARPERRRLRAAALRALQPEGQRRGFTFDDRPAQRVHRIEALQLALPSSNPPSQLEVTVEPHLAFRFDGATFDSGAQAVPFAERRRGELKPARRSRSRPVRRLRAGHVAARPARRRVGADLAFALRGTGGRRPERVVLSGRAGSLLALAEPGGAPLLEWSRLEMGLRDVQPLARRIALAKCGWRRAAHLAREADGACSCSACSPPRRRQDSSAPASAPASGRLGSTGRQAPSTAWRSRTRGCPLERRRHQAGGRAAARRREAAGREARLAEQGADADHARGHAAPPGRCRAGRHLRIEARGNEREVQRQRGARRTGAGRTRAPRGAGAAAAPGRARRLAGRFEWSADSAAPKTRLLLDKRHPRCLAAGQRHGRGAREEIVSLSWRWPRHASICSAVRSSSAGSRWRSRRGAAARWGRALNLRPDAARSVVSSSTAAQATPPGSPWQIRVKDLQLDGGRVRWPTAFAAGRAAETPLAHRRQRPCACGPGTSPGRRPRARRRRAHAAGARIAAGSVDWNGRFAPSRCWPRASCASSASRCRPSSPISPIACRSRSCAPRRAGRRRRRAPVCRRLDGERQRRRAPADVRVHTRSDAAGAGDELLSWQSFALDGLRFAMAPQATPQLEIRRPR